MKTISRLSSIVYRFSQNKTNNDSDNPTTRQLDNLSSSPNHMYPTTQQPDSSTTAISTRDRQPDNARRADNPTTLLLTFLFSLIFLLHNTGWGQFSGTYNFSTGDNVNSFNYNGTAISNLTVSALTKNGVTTSSSAGNFRASAWTTGSTDGGAAGGTIDLTDYFEFTITAASGYTISNPTLNFGVGRSATGPRRFQWRSSVDSYASALSVGTVNASIAHSSGVLTIPDANSGYTGNVISVTTSGQSSITFRFYAYGSEASGGTGGLHGSLTFGGNLVATPSSYTVTFDANGGSGSMANQTASSATALTSNAFTRTGYTFAGWNTQANGSGTSYANGASYPFSASTTLYAQWTANTYTVTFDPNSGSVSPTTKDVTYASTYGTLPTPTRTDFTFNGWNTALNGSGSTITSSSTVNITAAQTLYAQWTSSSSPNLAISGTTTHGSVCPNASASGITYTITNNGTAQANGVSVTSNDAQFVVSGLSSTSIAASGTATYTVTFTPSSAGSKTATITVTSTTSGSNSPTSSLSGTGTTPVSQAITASAASSVTAQGATLNGNVTTLGVCPATTDKGFVYAVTGINSDPLNGGAGVTKTSVASLVTGAYTLALTGLTAGTQYSFKAYLFDGTTYTYSSVLTFTTTADFISLSSLGTAVTENFNTLASSGTSSDLPQGWYFSESGSNANITYTAGTGSGNGGDTYSFGLAANSDRAFGGLQSGSNTPTIGAKITNNTGTTINNLSISYTGETWRVGATNRSDRLDFQYSLNATSLTNGTWINADDLDYANSGQGSTGNGSVQHSSSISNSISSLSIANGATIWIRWIDLNVSGANDGMAIDDFSITASVSASAPTLVSPVTTPTVDGAFTVTFEENSTWRNAITGITVGGTNLSSSAFSISAGQITFTPSASALLQSSGSKSIAVIATGYSNATLTQTINPGAATNLFVSTQPAAPNSNGGALATQPVVRIRDQYNNTVTGSSASVTASVGSSGTWTLGGTASVNASAGVATFSGLTATSAAAVTGANITFTSGSLSVTSSNFNIPAPAPANNTCGSAATLTLNASAVSGTLAGATVTSPFSTKIDVWYKFDPTCNGTHQITVTGFTGDVDIELFQGPNCPAATNVLSSSASQDPSELISGNLTTGTTYYLRVLAFDEAAQSSTFTVHVTETNCKIDAPVAAAATIVYNNGFQANWSAVGDAAGYRLDVSTTPIASDLFISEYVEGSSSNKYIEIFNGTGRTIDLSDYRLMLFANGGTTATNDVLLSGTLASGSTVVYKNQSANLSLPGGVSASNNTATNFNGDDAIVLYKVSTNSYVDIFGRIGEDPGTAWTATNTTLDRTLRRKSSVTGGVTSNPSSGFPTLATEWDQFSTDVVSGLGSHTSVAIPSLVTGYSNLSVSDTKQLVSGLSANTTYYYAVRATDATRTSANSNVITVTTANTAAGPLPNIWVGTTNGSWNDPANWSYGTRPSTTGNTLIDDGTPLLDIDFTLASTGILTLSDNGSLVIAAGKTLTIAGTADFGGRPVTLKSDATGTAAIGQVTGQINGVSAVTVERYMPAQRKWRMLTAPLVGGSNNSIYYNWQNNGNASASTGAIFWGPASSGGLYPGGNGYNLLRFNASTGNQGAWENVTSTTTAGSLFDANANKSYIAFITGPYNTTGNYISGSPAATTISATGTLRTGQVQFTDLAGGVGLDVRFHMIGNPYASAVNFSAISTSGTSGFFYVWDPKVGTLGAYSAIPSNSAAVLESGQAFLVGVPSGNTGSVTFDEADKSSATNNVMFRTQNNNPRATIKLYKTVNNTLTLFDQAWVDYQPDANPDIDGNDAPKPSNFTENLSIFRFGRDLMVERRPMFTQNDTLQLRLWRTQQTSYQMQLAMENFNLPAGSTAVLEDRYLNTSTPIVLSGLQTINFSVNADAASSGERFRIVFRPSVVTSVNNLNGEKGFRVYPNPVVKGSSVQLEFRNKPAGKYTLTLYTIAGVQVQQTIITHIGGISAQPVKLLSHLAAGAYVAEIAGTKDTEKIMLTLE